MPEKECINDLLRKYGLHEGDLYMIYRCFLAEGVSRESKLDERIYQVSKQLNTTINGLKEQHKEPVVVLGAFLFMLENYMSEMFRIPEFLESMDIKSVEKCPRCGHLRIAEKKVIWNGNDEPEVA